MDIYFNPCARYSAHFIFLLKFPWKQTVIDLKLNPPSRTLTTVFGTPCNGSPLKRRHANSGAQKSGREKKAQFKRQGAGCTWTGVSFILQDRESFLLRILFCFFRRALMDCFELMGLFRAGQQETGKIHFETIAQKLFAYISTGNGDQRSMLSTG